MCACVRGVRATAAKRQLVRTVLVAYRSDELTTQTHLVAAGWTNPSEGGKWPRYGCVIILEVIVLRVMFFILLNTRGHESVFLQREKCFASELKHFWNPIAFMMSKPVKSGIALQHHRIFHAGRCLWKSFSPTPLLKLKLLKLTWSRWS